MEIQVCIETDIVDNIGKQYEIIKQGAKDGCVVRFFLNGILDVWNRVTVGTEEQKLGKSEDMN